MDLPLVRPASDFILRRRRALALLTAAGITSYAAYSAYHHPVVVQKRQRLARLLRALLALTEALTEYADTVSLVAADLGRFLRSDSDEIPASIRQISKIACSDEVSASVSRVSGAVAAGVVGAVREAGVVGEGSSSSSGTLAGQVIDKVFSPAGTGFVSVVAGQVARGLVAGVCSTGTGGGGSSTSGLPDWAGDLLVSENSRKLMGDCIQQFVSTAVTTYLDKTMQVNTYDEMLAGLTNPKHEAKVKDVLVSVCNGAVETLVRTSHQVITSARTSATSPPKETQRQAVKESESPSSSSSKPQFAAKGASPSARPASSGAAGSSSGGDAAWVKGVSSTLSVPSNRRFVLDVTGRVTFETVRSILDFFLSRLYDCSKLGVNFVHQEVVRKGIEVLRYVGAKSMLILTACLSICLHLVFGSKLLIAA